MVATSAWELPAENGESDPNPDRRKPLPKGHRKLLDTLLSPAAGRSWIGRDNQGPVAYEYGPDAVDLANTLANEVEETCAEVRERVDRSRTKRRTSLEALRHRIILEPAWFRKVVRAEVDQRAEPTDPTAVHLIALDLRFDFYLDRPQCHVSLSVWSARPWHARYVPTEWPHKTVRQHIGPAELRSYADEFRAVLRQTLSLLKVFLTEADLRVYRRKHVLPVFWIPVPGIPDPTETDGEELRNHLAHALLELGSPAECVAHESVVNGQFDVVRRFRRGIRQTRENEATKHLSLSRAHYLIIPGPPPGLGPELDPRARRALFEQQEDETADVVTKLTDLEARGASNLHEIHRDLQILRNHLDVYDRVVDHGAFLWDGLSTHLVTQRRFMRQVHHVVELLHQILLQGIGDLAHLSNRTRDCEARVEDAADQLRTAYDDELTEHHPEQTDGLRGALARTGLFEKVKQDSNQTLLEATRVKAIYDDLLRAIGYAFDERRVREADVLQRLSGALGVVLALSGIVTVFDATLDLKPSIFDSRPSIFGGPGWLPTSAVVLSWAVGGVLLITFFMVIRGWRHSGQLGSSHFRRQYSGRWWRLPRRHHGVWRLLKDISTDRLDRIQAEQDTGKPTWAESDENLTSRFATLWDCASAMGDIPRRNWIRRDIKAQARRIEQWGVQSLLLTERARRMHVYNLPRLAFLYRACTRFPGSSFGRSGQPRNFGSLGRGTAEPNPHDIRTMIDFNEFALVLRHLEVTWEEAYLLELWLLHRQPQNARHLLVLLDDLGLAADMPKERVSTMVERVTSELDEALPRYPEAFLDDLRGHLTRQGYTDWEQGDPGDRVTVTARYGDRPRTLHVWLGRAPRARDLGPRRAWPWRAVLVVTGSIPWGTRVVAWLVGMRTVSLRWSNVGGR